jgi:hypothetical protein
MVEMERGPGRPRSRLGGSLAGGHTQTLPGPGSAPSRVRLGTRWEPILTWSGPWRLSGRWWAGERDADRYQLVTSAGALLCVVADGKAYLAGVYD